MRIYSQSRARPKVRALPWNDWAWRAAQAPFSAADVVNSEVACLPQRPGPANLMNSKEVDILLVDDSVDDVELTLHALRGERLANRVFVARDGEEALEFIFSTGRHSERSFDHPPKLVLLDLKLPKVDGLQVLQRMKSDERTKTIPVVMLTSSKEERDRIKGYELGANSFLQKPVDFDEFRKMVKLAGLYWMVVNQPPVVVSNAPAVAEAAK